MPAPSATRKTFKTKVKSIGPSGAWSMLPVEFDVEKEWGIRARVSVRGEINGYKFRTSIFPDGKGGHTMMVNKAMQKDGGAIPGKTIRVTLEKDTAPRVVTPPKDFKAALAGSAKAREIFEEFSPSHKRAYVDWITQAKREETRASRIAKAIEMIAEGKKRM
jgi:hypothetical protein